jgi:hypothetical protein
MRAPPFPSGTAASRRPGNGRSLPAAPSRASTSGLREIARSCRPGRGNAHVSGSALHRRTMPPLDTPGTLFVVDAPRGAG